MLLDTHAGLIPHVPKEVRNHGRVLIPPAHRRQNKGRIVKLLPYFRWYPADAETDENFREMSDAEIGFYVRCLNHTWINQGISSDPGTRARVLRVSRTYHDKMWIRVGRCFQQSEQDPGRLVNKRQEEERLKATEKSRSASASVRTRYESSTNVESTYEKRSENVPPRAFARADSDSDSVPSVFVSSSENGNGSVSICARESDGWEEYLTVFLAGGKLLNDRDIQKALQQWLSLSVEDQVAALSSAKDIARGRAADFIPFPVNHLLDKPWTRRGPGRLIPEPAPPRRMSRAEVGQAKAAAEFLAERNGQ